MTEAARRPRAKGRIDAGENTDEQGPAGQAGRSGTHYTCRWAGARRRDMARTRVLWRGDRHAEPRKARRRRAERPARYGAARPTCDDAAWHDTLKAAASRGPRRQYGRRS